MDAFTMVIMACVAGEAHCATNRVSEMDFTSVQACEARIDDITRSMTREFGKRPEFKGRQVTYDVSCMDRAQLAQKFGITSSDT
ncbi:hypothetical protein ARD30_14650 [Bosea thiooxidans]|uniref:Uncharacterized protein n=1 Tax=Bosea thiooxidans TaxID=53254 RepID=A0A0Q3I5I8_9HYPH|nr:hypothetical protein [Bosea thiooxidans]KQK30200.1 hypothetical protein ARD30_14650 [Bosea thiooxidans]SKB67358.1 hypothetical protein SAMN05660750_01773 [Bosea thiooxidans]